MFSEREQKIIKIIGNKYLSIKVISKKLFKEETLDANIKILNSINRINKKCELNKLLWKLDKHSRNGKLEVSKVVVK